MAGKRGNMPWSQLADMQAAYQQPESMADYDIPLTWVDQLAQNMLLTAQAFQRLHASLDQKFSR